MSEFTVQQAKIRDWPDIEALVLRLQASRFSKYVTASLEETEAMLINSSIFPATGLLLLRWGGQAIGIAAMLAIDAPRPGVLGIQAGRHAFVHSVFIDPSIDGVRVPTLAGKEMCLGMENWAKSRGATYIYGNVRMDGHIGALLKKFGWEAQHYVVGKEFKDGQQGQQQSQHECHTNGQPVSP